MYKVILISTLVLFNTITAQLNRDSLVLKQSFYNKQLITTYFEKQLNTYHLNSLINYSASINRLFIGINENFKSTFIRTYRKNIKDEQFLSLFTEYTFSNPLKLGFLLLNKDYSDNRNIALNKSSIFNSSLFARLQPLKILSITPFIGLVNNRQIGIQDKGIVYGSEASLNNLNIDEFNINSSLKIHNEDISPRKNTLRYFKVDLKNKFQNKLNNHIGGYYSQLRKDFYFEADSITSHEFEIENNIQSRTESNYLIKDNISYNMGNPGLSINMAGRISWRDIDRKTKYVSIDNIGTSSFDSNVEEFKIDLLADILFSLDKFNSVFRILHSERNEKHIAKNIEGSNQIIFNRREDIENQKNNKSQQTTITATGALNYSSYNILQLNLFHRKLIYETPSSENYDDRDELLSIIQLSSINKLNPFFDLIFNFEGSLNKIVYIFAQRSSNNNIRRSLKFSASGNYKGTTFSSKNIAEVSANYTVYDFEDLNPNYQSFSFRQISLKDSSLLKINRNLSVSLLGYIKLSEQGDFNWTDFSGNPIRFLEEIYLEPKCIYTYQFIKFGLGLRFFSLSTFSYNNDVIKVKDSEYKSIGPLSEVAILYSETLKIRFYGWLEFINNEKEQRRKLGNLFIQITWNI
ncbi:hypothetical protein ACFLS9_09240 [Bacteroidota bacterium]